MYDSDSSGPDASTFHSLFWLVVANAMHPCAPQENPTERAASDDCFRRPRFEAKPYAVARMGHNGWMVL